MIKHFAFIFALAGLVLAGCEREEGPKEGPGTNPTTQPQKEKDLQPLPDLVIEITKEHTFNPAEITVQTGQSVVWKNLTDEDHTVTCDLEKVDKKELVALPEGAMPFDSGDIKAGGTFRMSFSVTGTYGYVCNHHEEHGMAGKITVVPRYETPGQTPERP